MAKEALVIILDIGRSMGNLRENSGMTGLDEAKAAFRLIVQQKLLFGYKQDVCSLILFNSDKTVNLCHDEYGGYDYIEQHFELSTPNLDLLECIDNIECNRNGESAHSGDPLDGLLVGAQIIIDFVKKKKYKKRIFLITDATSKIKDIDQIRDIANSFISENIKFNCIGVGFGEEDEEDDDDDDDNDDEDHEKQKYNSYRDIKLIRNNKDIEENEKILRYFSHLVNGTVFCSKSAIKLMSDLRSKSVLLRPAYSGSLQITSKLSISVKLYTRCREQTLPSLKKQSVVSNETGKVLMDRVYKNKFRGNQDDEEVEEEERVKSYLYGKERIPFTEDDEARLNYKSGDRHFKCLGFVHRSNISRCHFMASTNIVTPDLTSSRSQYLLSALIRSCHEKGVNILCRLVSRKNSPPKLVVLQPRIKTLKESFILNELPFYEDIRRFPFASFNINPKHSASKQQIRVCKDMIKSLNLMSAAMDDDGDKMEALKPQHTFNPILQRFYQNLQNRALDPMAPLQPLDPIILKALEPHPHVFEDENTIKCIKQFETVFPTKIIPKKEVKKERKHWNEISNDLDNLFNNININNNIKSEQDEEDEEDDLDLNIELGRVTVIGTTNPCNDFDYLLSKQSSPDLFERLSNEFWSVIYNMIDKSYGDMLFDKALSCIIHLKKSAIKEEEPLKFNEELTSFKAKYKQRNKKLWRMSVDKKITLICVSDFDVNGVPEGLTLTKNESEQFLIEKEDEKIEINKDVMDQDDDDFFDELE